MRLLLGDVEVDVELDVVADDGRGIFGAEVEVAALDGGGGGEAFMRLVVHAWNRAGGAFCMKCDGLGDAVEGEVALDGEAVGNGGDAGADKGGGGELGDIEHAGALEVGIASADACIDGGDVDGDVDGGLGDVRVVHDDFAADVAKAAVNLGEAQVQDGEVDIAVRAVRNPGGGLRKSDGSREREYDREKSRTLHPNTSFRDENLMGLPDGQGRARLRKMRTDRLPEGQALYLKRRGWGDISCNKYFLGGRAKLGLRERRDGEEDRVSDCRVNGCAVEAGGVVSERRRFVESGRRILCTLSVEKKNFVRGGGYLFSGAHRTAWLALLTV